MVENNNKQIENIQYDLFDKHIKGSITNDYMCYAVYTSIGDLGKKYYFKSTWTFDKVLASLSSEIENEYYDSKERIIQKNINGDKYYFLLLPYIFPLEKYSDSGGRKVTFFQIIVTKKNILSSFFSSFF